MIFLDRVAVGDGDGDVGDVADLGGEIAGHLIDRFGEFLPDARDALHFGLAAEFAFGADFAGDADDFDRERAELINHAVDEFGGAEVFAFERAAAQLQRHGLGQIAFGHGADDAADFDGGLRQFIDHGVDGFDAFGPGADGIAERHAFVDFAFLADLATEAEEAGIEILQAG